MLHDNTSLCVCLAHRIFIHGESTRKSHEMCVCDDPSPLSDLPMGKYAERWRDVA